MDSFNQHKIIGLDQSFLKTPLFFLTLCLLALCIQVPAVADLENINSKIQILEGGVEDDANRLKALELYQRAQAYAKEANNYAKKSIEFKETMNSAAMQVERILQELKQLPDTPDTTGELKILPSDSLQELEQYLSQQQGSMLALRNKLSELEDSIADERSRPQKIQVELTGLQHELEAIEPSPTTAESMMLNEAQQVELEAHRQMIVAHTDMLQQELLSHEIRLQLLTSQRNLTAQKVALGKTQIKRLQTVVNQRRTELAVKLQQDTGQATGEASGKHPLIREITEQNTKLSDQLTQLTTRIEQITNRRNAVTEYSRQLEERYRYTKQQLEFAGATEVLGEMLRGERAYLADTGKYRREAAKLQGNIAQAGLSRIQIEKQRRTLDDEERQLEQQLLTTTGITQTEQKLEAQRSEIQQLLQDREKLLQVIADTNNSYLQELHSLDAELKRIANTREQFSILLSKQLLWVSSTSKVGLSWFSDLQQSVIWFLSPTTWSEIINTFLREAGNKLLYTILILLIFAGLMGSRRRMSTRLDHTSQYVGKVQTDKMSSTFEAIGITILLATPWPLLVAYAGWLLRHSASVPGELPEAAGLGLLAAAAVLYVLSIYRWLAKNHGVAEIHFNWSDQARHVAWYNLRWFMIIGTPLVFIIFLAEGQPDELHRSAIGRLAFIVASMALALFAWRTLRPRQGVLITTEKDRTLGWMWNARYVLLPLAVGVPVVLIILAITGYYFTALQLETRLFFTLVGTFAAFLLYNLLTRWLLVAQRRIALARARARRNETLAATTAKKAAEASGDAVPDELDIPEVTLESISEQSRTLIHLTTALSLIFTLWWVWRDILPALSILEEFTLWNYLTTIDGAEQLLPITLKHIGLAIVTLLFTVITVRNLPALFEVTLLSKLSSNPGTRYAIIKLSRYAIIFIGVLVAVNIIGFQWNQIQWLIAALGIGLGFGLQEIVMNFISGLIILVERPIRVGDTVTIGNVSGTVSQIRIRATTIVDWDNKALVVPNKTFITDKLINWTLTGPVTRLVIKVGIAYGSDTKLAHQVLMEVAQENPLVLDDPAPTVFFLEFGDSALLFELRVFVHDQFQRLPLTDELHMSIDHAFREHKIEIAYPQLDVRMHSES